MSGVLSRVVVLCWTFGFLMVRVPKTICIGVSAGCLRFVSSHNSVSHVRCTCCPIFFFFFFVTVWYFSRWGGDQRCGLNLSCISNDRMFPNTSMLVPACWVV